MRYKETGIAIPLAWPETKCKQAGAWYDVFANAIGINQGGYYKVGHSAIILISTQASECLYFDFGRYHAPHGHGRVRSARTDHDLTIKTKPVVINRKVINLQEILFELQKNSSTHGTGPIYGTQIPIDFAQSHHAALKLQEMEFIYYGPFVPGGTNCSRFVNKVLRSGILNLKTRFKLKFPLMLSPSPLWNLRALPGEIIRVNDRSIDTSTFKYQEMRLQA